MLGLTLLAVDRAPGNPVAKALAVVSLSGLYAAGGDVLNLSQLFSQTDFAGRTMGMDPNTLPLNMEANSLGSLAGNNPNAFYPRAYTNPNSGAAAVPLTPQTCLMQFYDGATELAAGAYSNTFLSDFIVLEITYKTQN